MKLTNTELTTSFVTSLAELSTMRTNTKIAFNTAKTIKSTNSAIESFQLARKTIVETRCIMGEDQKPVMGMVDTINNKGEAVKQLDYTFTTPELKTETLQLINELNAQEVEIEIYPIKISDFGSTEISATTILGLKDFIIEG